MKIRFLIIALAALTLSVMNACTTPSGSSADAVLEKVGGPGKQFWSDGRNWPLPADKGSIVPDETWPMLGQWRVEVKPGSARKADVFMHMIKVGDEAMSSMPATSTFETTSEIGVEFTYEGKDFRIAFDKTSNQNYGCNITVKR